MVAAVLAATACGGSAPVAAHTPTAVASASAVASPSATGAPSSSPSAMPAKVTCGARPSGGPMVMLGGLLYDVTDPVHPRRLCAVANTSAHIWTEDTIAYLKSDAQSSTSIVLHSIGSGNESVTGHIPYPSLVSIDATIGWAVDGSVAAATIPPPQPVAAGDQSKIWIYSPGFTGVIDSYDYPLTDCICRFGLIEPVTSISPDHQYLLAGWPVTKAGLSLTVYRIADRTRVYSFDRSVTYAMWDRTGHRLYATGSAGSMSWTPENGPVPLAGASAWSYVAGLSPDGTQVAYTAYYDNSDPKSLRVFVYDLKTGKTSMLRDALRSQVVFVKPGWVWYLEETTCDVNDSTCGPWGTKPSGKVLAMNLADGVERQVDFLYAEDTTYLVPGEFWPSGA